MTSPAASRDPASYWLRPMLRVVRRSDTEIRRLLEKAAQAAESDVERLATSGTGAIIRRGQLSSATQAINKTLRLLFADVGDTVRAGRVDAANAALLSAYEWEEPYYRAAGLPKRERDRLRAATAAMSERNVNLMLRRFKHEQIPLSRQVYKTKQLAKGWVDKAINLGIGRGLTARELARDVRDLIQPGVRGGVSYAAMRLARTELNNSFHAAARESVEDKPWVTSMEWHLSGSHPKEDICDLLATEDRYDLGSGLFPRDNVPDKPHPQCFCYVVPGLVEEDDFVAAFAKGEYDDYFDEKTDIPEISEKRVDPIEISRPAPKTGRDALDAVPLRATDPSLDFLNEQGPLGIYKGQAYRQINEYLRVGSGGFYQDMIEGIDSAMGKSKLKDDAIFWRGVKNPRAVLGDRVDGDLSGLKWIEQAYLSMTADKRVADNFASRKTDGGMMMRITVRKGSPVIKLSDFAADSPDADLQVKEAEGLGGRGWTLQVTADHGVGTDGTRLVDVEVVKHARSGKDPWKR